MGVYELRIRGLRNQATVVAVRWELFVFWDVQDVIATRRPETVAVLYEGDRPDPDAWCATLRDAGFDAEPAGDRERVLEERGPR